MGGKPGLMGGKPGRPVGGKPASIQQVEQHVMEMMMNMIGLTITQQGEAELNVNCNCIPMEKI